MHKENSFVNLLFASLLAALKVRTRVTLALLAHRMRQVF
jgi:hypothetical protein